MASNGQQTLNLTVAAIGTEKIRGSRAGPDAARGTFERIENELDPDDISSWEVVFAIVRKKHGSDGVWAGFQLIQSKGRLDLLTLDGAEALRDEVLRAALVMESRIAMLADVAQLLFARDNFKWPGLYMKVMHFFLERASYDAAVRWHTQLVPAFPPQADVFGALLASFVTNPTPRMQSTLSTLYVLSVERNLYDYIVPALFASGQSKLARTWRKKFTLFKDHPSTSKSRPFLRFLLSYYPSVQLTERELAVVGLDHQHAVADDNPPELAPEPLDSDTPKGLHSDSVVARWFASTWTSVEFAINLAHRLGVRVIGPRALQSLALREQDLKDVTARIDQLEKLGIGISSQKYCNILVTFARNGEDELLSDLLHCDIHPDEFEDIETRQMLLAEATRQGDWKRERLFQGIEWIIETGPASRRLNTLLRSELANRSLTRARALLDRMGALKIDMSQKSAIKLLKRAFWGLGHHPYDRISRTNPYDPVLDRAVDVTRRIAHHDVAIPAQYWKVLLYNLGRSRRLSQLEQLALEIIRYYSPPYGGLIPVHREDFPAAIDADEKQYIPADLPFAHHEHPIRRIFNHQLQRRIVRWAFDQTLAIEPDLPTLLNFKSTTTFAEFDVARGVRLLAQLRDQGVLIDTQVLRSSILSRIALGHVPGRLRDRARDSNEVSVQHLNNMIEQAWGSKIFPSLQNLIRDLEAQKPKLWRRYPRLFAKAYNESP
ncbi:hypothetical protein PT974_04265 [Cladobotryum mycophilum]|uniref:Pentatricopeptide repeat domain-containing protein n=1 Tax=Cladobotryum mycophilum TaxID=491253 RepID=A0ABR0SUK6_9HYPO